MALGWTLPLQNLAAAAAVPTALCPRRHRRRGRRCRCGGRPRSDGALVALCQWRQRCCRARWTAPSCPSERSRAKYQPLPLSIVVTGQIRPDGGTAIVKRMKVFGLAWRGGRGGGHARCAAAAAPCSVISCCHPAALACVQ
eukprot:350662-Chlamydomonas_euryale.AAC.1